jgi:hypothetical protein
MSTAKSEAFKKWQARRANETRALTALEIKNTSNNASGMRKYAKSTKIEYNKRAHKRAVDDIEKLKKAGILTENDMAEEALKEALIAMRGAGNAQTKLAAAKLILDFTKSKPVAKSDVTVRGAEAWLEELTKDTSE